MMDDSNTPADQTLLRKLAKQTLNNAQPFYKKLYSTPIKALFFSVALLLILSLVYLTMMLDSGCNKGCSISHQSIFVSGIDINAQTLDITYYEHTLNKILLPAEINNIKKTLDAKYLKAQTSIIETRLLIADKAKTILSDRLGDKYLPKQTAALKIITSTNSIQMAKEHFPIKLNDVINTEINPVMLSGFKSDYGKDAQTEFAELTSYLDLQSNKEKEHITSVEHYIASMKPTVSFGWLAKLHWVTQLIFWTLFGVIINNIVWLIRLTKDRQEDNDLDFSPDIYLTLFARLAIAPFISVCFLAMLSGGLTEFALTNLNNLPAFLVAAFFLGFMSEAVTLKIRQFFNKLVDSIEYKKQPNLKLIDISPMPEFRPLPNNSLANLEANMKGLLNRESNNIKNEVVKNNHLDK